MHYDFEHRSNIGSAKSELIRTFEEVYQTPINADLKVEYDLNKDQLIIISDERLHITQEKDFRLVGMKQVEYERYGGYFAISEPDVEYRYYFKM